jgi:hypothetical protein
MRYILKELRFDTDEDRIRETSGQDRIVAVLNHHNALNGVHYVLALVELRP